MLETRTAHCGVVDSIKTLHVLIKTLNPIGLERKLRKRRSTEGKGIIRTYGNFMVKAGLESGPKRGPLYSAHIPRTDNLRNTVLKKTNDPI